MAGFRLTTRTWMASALLIAAAVVGCTGARPRQGSRRVSVDDTGRALAGLWPSASADGRIVAFLGGRSGARGTIFVKDRKTGALTRVTRTDDDTPGSENDPSISADGRIVAFVSTVAFVTDDTNDPFCLGSHDNSATCTDVYVHDRTTGTTTRVSVASNNTQANGICEAPRLSGDGRFVVFQSRATTLTADRLDGKTLNVFLRDRQRNTTTLVSVSDEGRPLGGRFPSISDDGTVITFLSDALYVRDMKAGTLRRVTAAEALRGSFVLRDAVLSADGRVVALSIGTDLPPPEQASRPVKYAHARYDLVLYTIASGQSRPIDSIDTLEIPEPHDVRSSHAGFAGITMSGAARVLAYCRNSFEPIDYAQTPMGRRVFRLIDTATGVTRSSDTDPSGDRDPVIPRPSCLGHALSRDGTVLFLTADSTWLAGNPDGTIDIFAIEGASKKR